MKLTELKDNPGAKRKPKSIGRGIGSGKGKTSGRGGKGQTARSGVAINGFEGGQMPIHRRLPKRGFNSLNKEKIEVINLQSIEKLIDKETLLSDEIINKELLKKYNLIRSKNNKVKLLAKGSFSKVLKINIDFYSSSAKKIIENLGGQIL